MIMDKKKVINYLKKRPIQTTGMLLFILYFLRYFILREMRLDKDNPKEQIQVYINLPYSLAALHKLYLPMAKLEAYARYGNTAMFVHTNSEIIYLY
jgi:hypothetical protein